MPVLTYSPKDVILTVGGNPIGGYADGTFIKVTQVEDSFTQVVGADGQVSRTKSANRAVAIELTLKQTSPSNDVLSALHRADQIANAGTVPVQVKDLSGTTLCSAAEGWIKRLPDVEFGKDMSDRTWMLDTGPAQLNIGGNQ